MVMKHKCTLLLELWKKNNCNEIYVEINRNDTLAIELRRYAKERKKKRISVRETFRTQHKETFIADLMEPLIKIGRLYVRDKVFSNTILKDEMRKFPAGKTDDHIDAIAGAINELKIKGVSFGDEKRLTKHPLRHSPKVIQDISATEPTL